jgi:hypothetical protein
MFWRVNVVVLHDAAEYYELLCDGLVLWMDLYPKFPVLCGNWKCRVLDLPCVCA